MMREIKHQARSDVNVVSLPRTARIVITSAFVMFLSIFMTALYDNKWTELVFYLSVISFAASALIPTFRIPWLRAWKFHYDNAESVRGRFGYVLLLAILIVAVLLLSAILFVHIVLIFS